MGAESAFHFVMTAKRKVAWSSQFRRLSFGPGAPSLFSDDAFPPEPLRVDLEVSGQLQSGLHLLDLREVAATRQVAAVKLDPVVREDPRPRYTPRGELPRGV